MRRIFWALPLLFLVAVPLLLFNPSETVSSGYPVRWTLVTPTRKLTKDEKKILQQYTPNELAAQRLFLADQEAVQSIPTEAPGWVYNKTAADLFRCNTAPMDDKYWKDIGRRTNLITMNPGQVNFRYNSFGNKRNFKKIAFKRTSKAFKEAKEAFLRDLSVYGDSYLFIEAFLYELSAKRASLAHQVLLESHAKYEVIFPHPDFIRSVHSYWNESGVVAQRVSTGLLMASVATQICEEVHLYGFWPFHSDRNNRRLTEHYYDNALPSNAHKISEEFKQLQRLHNTGILRLTTTACQ
ncbi:ST8SIA6 [Branchiostoma lanceolatum]|uniref:ST8SIA6 protein n=1 Tax=Branchiostoma lanceolatum TaxID=7740 RepID=A0A8J9YNT8_BRALA|nr:ST8SIA6 [Branchiostoma lanceolatum]